MNGESSKTARRVAGLTRREFLTSTAGLAVALAAAGPAARGQAPAARLPNFVIIITDDQGYNDVGCFGAPRIKTPRLDRMAAEGMKFTDFYVAAGVCTPSRAALMTGCYPQRVGMGRVPAEDGRKDVFHDVLFPWMPFGLHPDEVTIADLLKKLGYATACVGKWHLGHLPPFLPTRQGFDSYFGIPYSNDMEPVVLLRDEEVVENPVDQATLTERYTEEAVRFIGENAAGPFFLYLAHTMPHIPLHVSQRFRGKSAGGLYGDVVECIDWSVGQVLEALAEQGIDDRTLVVFTSDNGPWLVQGENGGSATPLRAGKGTTYEGGMRVPCIMRWPGRIPAGAVCGELATTMDLLPTFAKLAGGEAPQDRIIDGKDIRALILGEPGAKSAYEALYYYQGPTLNAVRSGPWKLKLETTLRDEDKYRWPGRTDVKFRKALYNLHTDPGEQKSVYKDHRNVVEQLNALADQAREDLGDARTGAVGKNVRPIGRAKGRASWLESERR